MNVTNVIFSPFAEEERLVQYQEVCALNDLFFIAAILSPADFL